MKRALAGALLVCIVSRSALAEAPDGGAGLEAGPCVRAPDHDKGIAIWKGIVGQYALYARVDWRTRRQLDNWIRGVEELRQAAGWLTCDHPAFSPKELADAQAAEAKAPRWCAAMAARLASEQRLRTEVVQPLCEAVWGADAAARTIAQERNNPAGVVDLQVLHDAGAALQHYRAEIARLRPLYRNARGQDFVRWQDEGACVQEAETAK